MPHVSGSFVILKDTWAGDHLDFQASLLGQSTTGSVDVADDHERLEVQLPWVPAMLANKAKALVKRRGQLMLLVRTRRSLRPHETILGRGRLGLR